MSLSLSNVWQCQRAPIWKGTNSAKQQVSTTSPSGGLALPLHLTFSDTKTAKCAVGWECAPMQRHRIDPTAVYSGCTSESCRSGQTRQASHVRPRHNYNLSNASHNLGSSSPIEESKHFCHTHEKYFTKSQFHRSEQIRCRRPCLELCCRQAPKEREWAHWAKIKCQLSPSRGALLSWMCALLYNENWKNSQRKAYFILKVALEVQLNWNVERIVSGGMARDGWTHGLILLHSPENVIKYDIMIMLPAGIVQGVMLFEEGNQRPRWTVVG